MIELYTPGLEDLWFKEQMLGDEETMSYNHAYGGTIPFPKERWAAWHDRWITNHEGKRFYRYIKDGDRFVGETAYHLDEDRGIYIADVIVYAPFRGKGYGRAALQMLCKTAAAGGIDELYDDIAVDNPAIAMFLKSGFCEILRNDEYVLVKKKLRD